VLLRNIWRCSLALLPACTGWVLLGDESGPGDAGGDRDAMADVFDASAASEVAPAALSITPSSHDFGSVVFGQASGAFSFTVTNTGGTASGKLSVVISGPNAADFAQTSNCPTVLGAGGSCTASRPPGTTRTATSGTRRSGRPSTPPPPGSMALRSTAATSTSSPARPRHSRRLVSSPATTRKLRFPRPALGPPLT